MLHVSLFLPGGRSGGGNAAVLCKRSREEASVGGVAGRLLNMGRGRRMVELIAIGRGWSRESSPLQTLSTFHVVNWYCEINNLIFEQ